MKFDKRKPTKEVFVGSLRCDVDQDTESFLRPLIPVKTREIDGMIFTHYPDGHVEVQSRYEKTMEMVRDIKGRKQP